jgi:large subunit ribosomal protein L3
MTLGLLGTKLGMTHIFTEDGRMVPVTVVQAGPCPILQVKTPASDGYAALQIGFGLRRDSAIKRAEQAVAERKRAREESRRPRIKAPKQVLVTAAELGHAKRAGVTPPRHVREVRLEDTSAYQVGQELRVDLFEVGERVDVIGTSKGRGFAGPMKRHHASRGPETHGSNYHRRAGSMGASADPSHTVKGKPAPGHMGNERVTVLNLEVVQRDPERNLILLRGAVPGHPGALVMVRKSVRAARATREAKRKAA